MPDSDLYTFFVKTFATLSALPLQVQIVGCFIVVLSLSFLWKYLIKGLYLSLQLQALLKDLGNFKKTGGIDPSGIFSARRGRETVHLWTEYKDTLHPQKRINPETGEEEIQALRATVPAETFFSTQALVDSRLSADFFRHLPGIFTGLGIIGTFSGLIKGLKAFNVSENTEVVRKSLESLLAGVSEAFVVSAIAIGLAMLVTLIEKSLLSSLHRKIEQLCYIIDSFFETGAGEEYLERLVRASEDSTVQSKNLKDSFIMELKQMMFDLNQKQISAFNEQISVFAHATLTSQRELGEQIVKSIEAGISKPLESIADVFRGQRDRAGDEISSALGDVLSSFSRDQNELLGGQITGINELQQKTLMALESAVSQLNKMMSDINDAGRGATDAMAEKMTNAISSMETRQQMMNATMSEFVGQIKNLVSQSQSETSRKLQELLSDLGQQVSIMVAELKTQAKEGADFHKGRQDDLSYATVNSITTVSSEMKNSMQTMQTHILQLLDTIEKQQGRFVGTTVQAVGDLAKSVENTVTLTSGQSSRMLERLSGLLENINANTSTAVVSIQLAVSDLTEITGSSVREMNDGSKTLLMASEEFGRASNGMVGIIDKAAIVSKEMSASAIAVTGSARMLEGIATDFRSSKQSLSAMLENLGIIVETARREASLTENILGRIEGSAQKLFAAQQQADGYLSSVSEVLAATHKEFSSNMRLTLKEVNTQFFDHLTVAVSRLREGIEELEATIGRIGGSASREG